MRTSLTSLCFLWYSMENCGKMRNMENKRIRDSWINTVESVFLNTFFFITFTLLIEITWYHDFSFIYETYSWAWYSDQNYITVVYFNCSIIANTFYIDVMKLSMKNTLNIVFNFHWPFFQFPVLSKKGNRLQTFLFNRNDLCLCLNTKHCVISQ